MCAMKKCCLLFPLLLALLIGIAAAEHAPAAIFSLEAGGSSITAAALGDLLATGDPILHLHASTGMEDGDYPLQVQMFSPDGQIITGDALKTTSQPAYGIIVSGSSQAEVTGGVVDATLNLSGILYDVRKASDDGCLPTGTYVLAYSLGDQPLGSVMLTVSAEESAAYGGLIHQVWPDVTVENGLVTIDWSQLQLPAGLTWHLQIRNDKNNYYTHIRRDVDNTTSYTLLRPGEMYIILLGYGVYDAQEWYYNVFMDSAFTMPESQALTGFSCSAEFQSFIMEPRSGGTSADHTPITVTREALLDPDHYVYACFIEDIAVEEDILVNVLFTLDTPSGGFYTYMDQELFTPALNGQQGYLFPINSLVDSILSFEEHPLEAGEYTFTCYRNGCEMLRTTFTLE